MGCVEMNNKAGCEYGGIRGNLPAEEVICTIIAVKYLIKDMQTFD